MRPHFAYAQVVTSVDVEAHDVEELPAAIRAGDAFDLVKAVPTASVDLLVTSPPYWGLRSYGLDHADVMEDWLAAGCDAERPPPYDWYRAAGGQLGLEPYPEWYIAHLVEFLQRAKRVLKPAGSVWLNLGDTYFARWSSIREGGRQGITSKRARRRTPSGGYLHDKQLLLIPARVAIALQEVGWILRNDLIWAKPNPLPRPETDRLRLSHEHWFHFVQRNPRGRPSYFYDLSAAEDGALDVVSTAPIAGTNGHTATFPSSIVRHRILTSSPPGGLVLDPFCGTGRAVIEAVKLGRRGLGFEKQRTFARKAARDIRSVIEKLDVPSVDTKGTRGGKPR